MFGLSLGLGLGGELFSASAWSPASFGSALSAWYRGDVFTLVTGTYTWTDQSSSGNNVTSNTVTTTTLGGQAAFSFASSSNFSQASANPITAGSIYTVLTVGQAGNSSGGAIVTLRRSATYSSSELLLNGSSTIFYGDGTAENTSVASVNSTILSSPFLSQHSYGGTGTTPSLRLNRSNKTNDGVFTGTQSTENGSTGIFIGTNSASQAWDGVIAEIVIVNRAITGTEQSNWENYILSRYGI